MSHGRLSSGSFYRSRFGPLLGARVLGAKQFREQSFGLLVKDVLG